MHEIKLCVKVWVNVAFSLKSFERSVTLRKKYLHTTSCFSQEYGASQGTLEQKMKMNFCEIGSVQEN